jgi:Rrf2 family protein
LISCCGLLPDVRKVAVACPGHDVKRPLRLTTMKLITRDTDYALKALCYIGRKKDGLVTAAELVQSLAMPRPFLRKILQMLQKENILFSYKGKSGGFGLKADPGKVHLTDIMRIFQGPLKLNECAFKKHLCPDRKTCVLRSKISVIEEQVRRQLEEVTLAELCKEG